MSTFFHADGSVDVLADGYDQEFVMQHHPTEAERSRRIEVELPAEPTDPPRARPVRLWVLPEDFVCHRDHYIVVDPADAERKLRVVA